MAEHAFGIKTLGDAVMLRAAVIALLEAASVEPDPEQRKKMLTFVVAGGGFAGIETIGAINDLARESLPHYGRIDAGEVRVVLIHGGPFILPELGETLVSPLAATSVFSWMVLSFLRPFGGSCPRSSTPSGRIFPYGLASGVTAASETTKNS